jgi:hypothetical protein
MAFDRSARSVDADGRLHVAATHISKANVCPYYGREIPGWQQLGLAPDQVYRLYRDPVELERGANTFARLPILSKHIPVTVDSPQPDLVIGAIGSDVRFMSPYLDADLCFWDSTAIAGIDTGKWRELSCAYRYVPVMEPGEFEGKAYDGRMTEIQGNHLALVQTGRAGSDVMVSDSNPFPHPAKVLPMKKTKLGTALLTVLSMISPKLAADSNLSALVGSADKTMNRPDMKAKIMAMDNDIPAEKVDSLLDTMLDVEENPEPTQVTADSPADQIKAMLTGKVEDEVIAKIVAMLAPAEDESGMVTPEMLNAAMDAAKPELLAQIRAEFAEADQARRDVQPVVGAYLAQDSAEKIYQFALDHLKVERKGVEGVPALRALFAVAKEKKPAPAVAADGSNTPKFNLTRFGRA